MNRWRTWWAGGAEWIRKTDLMVLVSLLIVVLGLLAFMQLANMVRGGRGRSFDEWALRGLRNPANLADPVGPVWLEETVRDVTALGGVPVIVMVTLVVAGFLAMRGQHHAVLLLLVAVGGALILDVQLKAFFDRPRPQVVPHLMRATKASFPSGHTLLSAVAYVTLGALLTRLLEPRRMKLYAMSIALLLTLLVGASRVYLGVHYPTDVLAGWSVGLAWAIGCWLAARGLQRRGSVERPQ